MAWKIYAQNSTQKENDNEERLKNEIYHNILAQSIIWDDIIEYETDIAEVAARIIVEIKDCIKEK